MKLQSRYAQRILMSVAMLTLSGCSVLRSGQESIPPSSMSNEVKIDRSFAQEQERRLHVCPRDQSCDRAHFTSALLVLHKDPEASAHHFREVIAIAPGSRLAQLSASWLKVLHTSSHPVNEGVIMQTNGWLLLELFSREQMLRRELSVRNKKLEELSRQLNALKQINLEMKEKNYLMRPRIKRAQAQDGDGN